MAAGLILGVMTLFMAPLTVHEACTWLNRPDFVRDELQVEFFHPGSGGDPPWLEGRIVSSGELFRSDRVAVVGLSRLRELSRENRLRGHRVPVWYLPKHGFWSAVDRINPFRVQSPDEFAEEPATELMLANLVIGCAAVYFIRRGARYPKARS